MLVLLAHSRYWEKLVVSESTECVDRTSPVPQGRGGSLHPLLPWQHFSTASPPYPNWKDLLFDPWVIGDQHFCFPSEFAIGHLSYLASLPYRMAKISLALKRMTTHQGADNLVSLLALRSSKPEQARPKLAPFVPLPHIHRGPSRSAP